MLYNKGRGVSNAQQEIPSPVVVGDTLYRLRTGDCRFYFEAHDDTVHVRYILHKNSLEDFLLRNKLPVSEQQLFEQHSKFWKYLDSLTR